MLCQQQFCSWKHELFCNNGKKSWRHPLVIGSFSSLILCVFLSLPCARSLCSGNKMILAVVAYCIVWDSLALQGDGGVKRQNWVDCRNRGHKISPSNLWAFFCLSNPRFSRKDVVKISERIEITSLFKNSGRHQTLFSCFFKSISHI